LRSRPARSAAANYAKKAVRTGRRMAALAVQDEDLKEIEEKED
jgi:hypothetical protein